MTVFSLLLFLRLLGICYAKCYYPNGNEAVGDFPCDPDAEDSVCCGGVLGNVCLSNKLCQTGNGNLIRGSCSDQSWGSEECSFVCIGPKVGPDLVSCSNVTGSSTSYCCDHSPGCCNSGLGRFNLLPEEPQAWATFNAKAIRFEVVGTRFSSEATRSEATTPTPNLTTSTSATTTSNARTSITSSNPATTSTTKSSPSDEDLTRKQSSETKSELSTGAIAGIAAGVGVSLILFLVAAFLFWRARKANSIANHSEKAPWGPEHDRQAGTTYYPHYIPKEPQEVDGRQFRAELPTRW